MNAGTVDQVYGSSSIKRRRRTRADIEALDAAICQVVEVDRPMTVRQVFYRLVSAGVIAKHENEYRAVGRRLTALRADSTIPYGWIADSTRWMRKPRTFAGLEHALLDTAEFYRRSLWHDAETYVEIWCEKDALAGVLYRVTAEYDVPLMVTRGYPSISYLYEAAEAIAANSKPAHLYYFGDHDPSGVDIPRTVESRIREYVDGEVDIDFEVAAVTSDQIAKFDLPTRPTKKTDTRSKTFAGRSVELDAIPPAELRQLVRDRIEQHVDHGQLDTLKVAEQSERELLYQWASEVEEGAL